MGTASSELSGLFKSGSWGFSLAPQALLPIFDAGRNRAGLQVAKTQRDIAVAQYEKAIQTAFREVSMRWLAATPWVVQGKAQQAQADAESERFRLAELRYRNGIASFLDVLDAQRSLFGDPASLEPRPGWPSNKTGGLVQGAGWRLDALTRRWCRAAVKKTAPCWGCFCL